MIARQTGEINQVLLGDQVATKEKYVAVERKIKSIEREENNLLGQKGA
jgi:hypothetical protein